MGDPKTFLLTVTNIALGAVLLVLILTVVVGVFYERLAQIRKRHSAEHEIDRDMQRWFHHSPSTPKRIR